MLSELQSIKEIVPDFIIKLYHILDKKQFEEYIAWDQEGTQVHIKNAKKLQEKVLPFFFRHKHITSFIRQLNMYKFSKVNKISKERSHMYFHNDNFVRDDIQKLKTIKRTPRPRRNQIIQTPNKNTQLYEEKQRMEQKQTLCQFQAAAKFRIIYDILRRISQKNPQILPDLEQPLNICSQMLEFNDSKSISSISNLIFNTFNDVEEEKKLLKLDDSAEHQDLQGLIMPSLCSLCHIDQ